MKLSSSLFRRPLPLFALLLLLFSSPSVASAADIANGNALFTAQCARCHKPYENGTGPALYEVIGRWGNDTTEISAWIKNSQGYLSGEPTDYAVALFAEWGSIMPAFPQFADSDVNDLLAYIGSWGPPSAGPVATLGEAAETGPAIDPVVLLSILAVLCFVAWLLSRVAFFLRQRVAEKYGEDVPEPVPFLERPGMKPVFGLGMFAVVCFLGYNTYDGATALGRQENYMPDQPIAFSHALHAGANKIDCRYCHTGAEKGKSAVIPSANVCMNCHSEVKASSAGQTEEIAKIYTAIGFNPENNKYEGEQEPIEWVRIHNLPDHVYFNHSQHVKAGGIECQTCHGPVEEMEVMYQYETLSMGWCVNCHRETEIDFTNPFYNDYDELHRQLAAGDIDAVHVADIGGEECQRCHY